MTGEFPVFCGRNLPVHRAASESPICSVGRGVGTTIRKRVVPGVGMVAGNAPPGLDVCVLARVNRNGVSAR